MPDYYRLLARDLCDTDSWFPVTLDMIKGAGHAHRLVQELQKKPNWQTVEFYLYIGDKVMLHWNPQRVP